ncbi:glucose-1-phosphate thymidylyltransferase [Oceanihabitans sp. IOP_32]|uniref:GlmU family protein n=1 Tax=Oceanihabitans sp. IOP_32 TaxID=2529032 RepID=UPI0012938EBC|nr:GlmU family protein [Oceanihabitans sp. IOP_32]QFZ53767.1 glucose-1-phosphate thymidylyltransferase [Oceanihabitans sp. IOP_32]
MNYILFDGPARNNLLPFTFTRPVADIRIGILTIREKWELFLGSTMTTVTEDYLSDKFPMVEMDENILINASYLPNKLLVDLVADLKENQAIFDGEDVIAFYTKASQTDVDLDNYEAIEFHDDVIKIEHNWDIFSKNGEAIQEDFNLITKGRQSQPIPASNNVIAPENIFVEQGATLEFATLNASLGPIYIGKDATIMEGVLVRGPLALGERAAIKMGAKIYGPTTIGPCSRVGGEIKNSVIFQNSNKGHEGYLGNSVLGEWCNLGADTNSSNLKNNYAEVSMWNYETENFVKTGLQFCGLMMGDHSKSGINTMFNTGTVVGVSANVFGAGFPAKFIPSFSWGGSAGLATYRIDKVFEVTKAVMERKKIEFTKHDRAIFEHVFELTKKYRKNEEHKS